MNRVIRVLEDAVETRATAGAVALVRHRGDIVLHESVGHAAREPEELPMTPETVFDLASLTKPLVGATLALCLVDRGYFSLDEEVTRWLPELESVRARGVTFRRLLSHTSGLVGWRPFYVWTTSRQEYLRKIDEFGLVADPGSRFEYSDVGYIALGLALERAADATVTELAGELIFEPLGLSRTSFNPDLPPAAFATTEKGNAFEKRMADWADLQFNGWRTDFHPGEVNDGNTHYGLGGVSAHAGLFSNAEEVALIGEMWARGGKLGSDRILSSAVVEAATREQAPDNAGRGLGWQLMRTTGPTVDQLSRADAGFFPPVDSPFTPWPSGELMGRKSFGHTGFTGTSIWIDPERELVAVLLANATHPVVDLNRPLNATRARFHNAVVASLD